MSLKNILLRQRGLGWIPDIPDGRDWPIDLLGVQTQQSFPKIFDLLDEYIILDQLSTNSCVANAAASAISILESRRGLGAQLPSRLFLYFNSRSFDNLQSIDRGTTIRSLCRGMVSFGVPDETYWPFSQNPITVNRRPGWNSYMMGYGRKSGKYYKIFSHGDDLIGNIQNAIYAGFPVIFGAKIAKSFLSNGGPVLIPKPFGNDQILGGHAVVAVGWVSDLQGVHFRIVNSWGDQWRKKGTAYLKQEYISSTLCSDFTIIAGWDKLKNTR